MLAFHGLVIIASEITKQTFIENSFYYYLEIEVASESRFKKKTDRHKLTIGCPGAMLRSMADKLQIGVVAEIVHGELTSYDYETKSGQKAIGLGLQVYHSNIRFLKTPFYYEGLKGLTEEDPNKQGESNNG